MVYVIKSIENQTIFDKSLGKAFKVFRNRAVGSALSVESLTTFCNIITILKNWGHVRS